MSDAVVDKITGYRRLRFSVIPLEMKSNENVENSLVASLLQFQACKEQKCIRHIAKIRQKLDFQCQK